MPQPTARFDRKDLRIYGLWAVIVGLISLYVITTLLDPNKQYRKIVDCMNCSEAEMRAKAGKPNAIHSGKEYSDSLQKHVAHSFEPDPPIIESDTIYEYDVGATMMLVFFKNGKPIKIYIGGT